MDKINNKPNNRPNGKKQKLNDAIQKYINEDDESTEQKGRPIVKIEVACNDRVIILEL